MDTLNLFGQAAASIGTASQKQVCGGARLGLRPLKGERHAIADHSDCADSWIRLWRLSSGARMGLLRRRRPQPDPYDCADSTFVEGDLKRAQRGRDKSVPIRGREWGRLGPEGQRTKKSCEDNKKLEKRG